MPQSPHDHGLGIHQAKDCLMVSQVTHPPDALCVLRAVPHNHMVGGFTCHPGTSTRELKSARPLTMVENGSCVFDKSP